MHTTESFFEPEQIAASVDGFARILEQVKENPERFLRDTAFRWEASPLMVSKLATTVEKQIRLDRAWLLTGGDGGLPPSVKEWVEQ